MRLPNDGELTLTWARLVTPMGYFLQRHGVVPTICTSGLSDTDSSLDTVLRQGADSERPRASLDDSAWSALRNTCPAHQGSPALDLKVAERVLSEPGRYTAALGVIRPGAVSALAPAVTSPVPGLTANRSGLSSNPRSP
jgi:carboxyl-terminal processing protease